MKYPKAFKKSELKARFDTSVTNLSKYVCACKPRVSSGQVRQHPAPEMDKNVPERIAKRPFHKDIWSRFRGSFRQAPTPKISNNVQERTAKSPNYKEMWKRLTLLKLYRVCPKDPSRGSDEVVAELVC